MHTKFGLESLKGRHHSEDLAVDGIIIIQVRKCMHSIILACLLLVPLDLQYVNANFYAVLGRIHTKASGNKEKVISTGRKMSLIQTACISVWTVHTRITAILFLNYCSVTYMSQATFLLHDRVIHITHHYGESLYVVAYWIIQ
jgi:hypothetical protein